MIVVICQSVETVAESLHGSWHAFKLTYNFQTDLLLHLSKNLADDNLQVIVLLVKGGSGERAGEGPDGDFVPSGDSSGGSWVGRLHL